MNIEDNKNQIENKIQWHQAFVGAVYCELGDDVESVDFESEYSITEKPLQIDLLIVKKHTVDGVPCQLTSSLGQLFSDYNIIEYKSPDDELGIDAFFQALTYACYYKSSADKENGRKDRDITVILVKHRFPRVLVEYLEGKGCTIQEKESGVYTVSGSQFFNIVVIASGRMNPEGHTWLNALRSDIRKEEYYRLVLKSNKLNAKAENYWEAVLSVVDKVNIGRVNEWKEDDTMASLLYQARAEGRTEGRIEGRTEGRIEGMQKLIIGMYTNGLTTEIIAKSANMTLEEVNAVLKSSQTAGTTATPE